MWRPGPQSRCYILSFSPGLWDGQGLSVERTMGREHYRNQATSSHPAGSEKEGTCGLLLLSRGLKGGMRSEDSVTQGKGHLLHSCTHWLCQLSKGRSANPEPRLG